MRCAIWYHFYNLKNVKNIHEGVLLLNWNFTKSNIPPWVFSHFLNCTNGTKLRSASHVNKVSLDHFFSLVSEIEVANSK